MTSENLISSSSHLLPASSHGAPDLILWILWERNEALWQCPYSWGSWVLTHPLPFPQGRNHGPRRSCLAVSVPPWGRGDAGIVKLFLLPDQCVQTHFFPALVECWNLSSGNLDYTRALSSVGDCPGQCSPGAPRWRLRGAGATHRFLLVPQPLLPDVQVGKTPPESLGEWRWIPQLPQRCFCLWMDANFCCWPGGQNRGTSCDSVQRWPWCL